MDYSRKEVLSIVHLASPVPFVLMVFISSLNIAKTEWYSLHHSVHLGIRARLRFAHQAAKIDRLPEWARHPEEIIQSVPSNFPEADFWPSP